MSVRIKYFGEGTGEKEVSEWSLSEDSMNYDGFSLLVGCSFNGSIPVILKRCPWLTFPTGVVNVAGDTALLVAVANSALNVVEYLVNLEGVDMNAKNGTGGGVLQIAARSRNVQVLNYVLAMKLDTDVNAEEKNGATALLHAAEVGFIEAVNIFLQCEGINVNHQTKNKWTALMLAACQGIQLSVNEDGDTALDLARKNKHPDIVATLELHLKGSTPRNLIVDKDLSEGVEKRVGDIININPSDNFFEFADLWENKPFS